MVKNWQTVNKDLINDFRIFKANWIIRKHPDLGKESKFVVLDSPNWVNIIPVTKNNEIVLIEQYRQGIDGVTLEVPGGLIDPGEDAGEAGERECREETGYLSAEKAELLGINEPNPAFMNNICYSYLWRNCEKNASQELDPHEDIETVLVPADEIKNYIKEGKIKHSLVLTAFFYYFLRYGNL